MTLSTHPLRTGDDFSEQNFYFRRLDDEHLKFIKNNHKCFEIIAFMRFNTSETLRSVVLDLKLASLLLGGLIFEDFRDCMSTLLCCEILTEESDHPNDLR